MTTTNTTTIWADFENNAETWWGAVRAVADDPNACNSDRDNARLAEGMGQGDTLKFTHDEAVEFLAWCQALPGWRDPDAPEHAPMPLCVQANK